MALFTGLANMEDLGFFPYPTSFGSAFDDVIMDPGPTSFFLKDPSGEDVLLGQGLNQLQSKLGWDLDNGSPVNVDDNQDWLMKDLSDDLEDPLDIPFTLNDLEAKGYMLLDGILQDPDHLVEPLEPLQSSAKVHNHEDSGLKCLVCNIALFRLKEVMSHVLNLHCSKGDYFCTLCNTQLLTIGSVKKHIKNVHFGLKPFLSCPVCKKAFQQKSQLKVHMEKVHKGGGRMKKGGGLMMKKKGGSGSSCSSGDTTCHLCHKVYLSVETKEKHLATFHKIGQYGAAKKSSPPGFTLKSNALQCPLCPQILEDLESKKTHVKNVHHNLRSFECSQCSGGNNVFYSQLHLRAHAIVEHQHHHQGSGGGSGFQCEYHNCKMMLKSGKYLLQHVEEFHAYQCPECPRHLQTTSGLAKHYKKAHISNELLCCHLCGNCYKDQPELAHHINEKHADGQQQSVVNSMVDSSSTDSGSSDLENSCSRNNSILVEKIMHPGVLGAIKKSLSKLAGRCEKNRIPCEYCRANETFESENQVLDHIKSMHPIQCPECPLKMFKYPTSVRKHFKKFHGEDTPFFCKTCTLVFTSADEAQDHMDNDHDGIANVVVVSQKKISSPPAATAHVGPKIACIVCGQTNFESQSALVEHRSEKHFYKCFDCEKEYKLTDSLRKHVKITHNEHVTLTCCKFCDKVFLDPSQKSGHVAANHAFGGGSNEDGGHLDCPKCPKSFFNVEVLQKHVKTCHDASCVIHACTECSLVFKDASGKNAHVSAVHQAKSLLKPNLNNHPGDNSEESLYLCPKCPKTYSIAKSLRKHCRLNHNKLSICFCNQCPKVFVTVSQRDLHQERDHPLTTTTHVAALKQVPQPREEKASSTIKTTISVNLQSSSSSTTTSISNGSSGSSNPRIIVVKSPNSKTGVMTTILKKVEVIQPQKCSTCQEFVTSGHVCTEPAPASWKCPFCPLSNSSPAEKSFKSVVGLRKHCRESHSVLCHLLEVCEVCQVAFKPGGLEGHNKEKHSGSIPSSPESFHGFVTPTKELEMARNYETVILNLNDIY